MTANPDPTGVGPSSGPPAAKTVGPEPTSPPPASRRGAFGRALVVGMLLAAALAAFLYSRRQSEAPAAPPELVAARQKAQAVPIDEPFNPLLHDRPLESAPWLNPAGTGQPGSLQIGAFTDKVVLLNFWATWCPPCVAELPNMLKLAEKMSGRPFVLIAVSYDASWAEIESFFGGEALGRLPANFVLARDPGPESEPLRFRYGTEKLPESYVIAGRRILDRFVAAHDWMAAEKLAYLDVVFGLGRGQ